MIEVPWTEDDRRALERTLAEEHMQKLLLKLHLSALPSSNQVMQPGLDIKEMASQAHAYTQGQVAVLEAIDLHLPVNRPKSVGKPFQAPKPPEPKDLNDTENT